MKQHFTFAGKLFLNRLFFNILAVIVIPVFISMIDMLGMTGRVLFALVICSLYLGVQMDMVWKLGKHDRQPYATEKPYKLKGFCVSLLAEVPFFIMYLLLILSGGAVPLRAIYRCLCIAPYMSLVPEDVVTIGYFLVLFIAPLVSLFPYIVGYRKPRDGEKKGLREKIMFKQK